MNLQDEIEGWLVRWASKNGGSIELWQGGGAAFTMEGVAVNLTLHVEDRSLLMAAAPVDESVASAPEAMHALLRYAHLGEQTRRCGVSAAESGRPVLWHWHSLEGFDTVRLDNSLAGMIATTTEARRVLLAAARSTAHGPEALRV